MQKADWWALAAVGAVMALAGSAGAQQGALVSPEVGADRRVTFRLRAPEAKQVAVSGDFAGSPQAMKKDDQGVWSVTVGPLAPELYTYGFAVDGLRVLDPTNREVKPGRSITTSIVEVAGDPPLPHEFQNVPHGMVRFHDYASKSLGKRRGLCVYTPPDYDRNRNGRYPVLYLLHGSGDNEATWTALGRAHLILDNLIARGQAKPMLIVMTDGHAAPPAPPGADVATRMRNTQGFEQDLLGDVIPLVEAKYRVRTDRESRALAGLSMGGGQSLTVGLNHPERFAWVGCFSSSLGTPETTVPAAFADPQATNARTRLLWIACGKDDRAVEGAQQLSTVLKAKGIRHELLISEGNHSWPVWRKYLAQFAPLLFAEGAASKSGGQ